MWRTNGVVADKVKGELPCVLVAVEPSCSPFINRSIGKNQTRPDGSHTHTHTVESHVCVSCMCVHECNIVHTHADARHMEDAEHLNFVSVSQKNTRNVWQWFVYTVCMGRSFTHTHTEIYCIYGHKHTLDTLPSASNQSNKHEHIPPLSHLFKISHISQRRAERDNKLNKIIHYSACLIQTHHHTCRKRGRFVHGVSVL